MQHHVLKLLPLHLQQLRLKLSTAALLAKQITEQQEREQV
jgi:hypothetical protein